MAACTSQQHAREPDRVPRSVHLGRRRPLQPRPIALTHRRASYQPTRRQFRRSTHRVSRTVGGFGLKKKRDFEKSFFSDAPNQLFCKTFLENTLCDPVSGEIGKSIIFAVTQNHALKIAQILNQMADRMFPGKAATK